MRTAKRDTQSPQASASTNSATRARVLFTDAVSQDSAHESSDESTGDKFPAREIRQAPGGLGVGNQNHAAPNVFVYGLIDPRTSLVFYVGQTRAGAKRPIRHAKCGTGSKAATIADLQRLGLAYEWTVLESIGDPDAPGSACWWRAHKDLGHLDDAEQWWIAYGFACGWPLDNDNHGGAGVRSVHIPPDDEYDVEIIDQRCPRCVADELGAVRWFDRDSRRLEFVGHAAGESAGAIAGAWALLNAKSPAAWALNFVAEDLDIRYQISLTLPLHERAAFKAARIDAHHKSARFAPFSLNEIAGIYRDNIEISWCDGKPRIDTASRKLIMKAVRATREQLKLYGVVRFCGRSPMYKERRARLGIVEAEDCCV